jgi:hypothetical protein
MLAELPLRAIWAVGHRLADVREVDAPELPAPRRASALGAGEIQRMGLGLRRRRPPIGCVRLREP